MAYLHTHISSCLLSIADWKANDSVKSAQSSKYKVTFLISKAGPVTVKCYMLHIPFVKICAPSPPTAMLVFPHFKSSSFQVYFFFLSVQQPTSRLLCLALTMHAFELASPSTAFSKLRKKGSSSACFRGSLENVVNWKHPQEYGKSTMEACKNVEHIHLLLFSCIRKPSFSMSCVTEGTLRTDPCASEVTALPSETQHFISQV